MSTNEEKIVSIFERLIAQQSSKIRSQLINQIISLDNDNVIMRGNYIQLYKIID